MTHFEETPVDMIYHRGIPSQPTTLREEPSQINVILQQKVLVAKFSAVCTVYKQ